MFLKQTIPLGDDKSIIKFININTTYKTNNNLALHFISKKILKDYLRNNSLNIIGMINI